ncbi:MAG: VTT domain-containing protein [bacterium]|nr:VTT domain-containing protein [bacterium]
MKIVLQKKSKTYLILAIAGIGILFLAVLLPSLFNTVPEIWQILQSKDSGALELYLRSFGWGAAVILFVLQFLQSILPIFPAIILQIVAGVLYGSIWGTILIVAANGLANYLVFIFLRRYDQEKIDKFLDFKFIHKFKVYFQSKNPSTIVFLFYLLPFLTNAFVPYFAATTKISNKNFLFSMVTATLPMTFLSVYLGDSLVRGEWQKAIVLAIILLGISLIAFFLKTPILNWLRHDKKKPSATKNTRKPRL